MRRRDSLCQLTRAGGKGRHDDLAHMRHIELGCPAAHFVVEAVHRRAAPAGVGVQGEDVVQQVVARSDVGEDAAHVLALGIPARDR